MNPKRAFKCSLGAFILVGLVIWVSKLLNYPPPMPVIYDQDAVINGTWRWLMVVMGFGACVLLFIVLTLYAFLKRKVVSVLQKILNSYPT